MRLLSMSIACLVVLGCQTGTEPAVESQWDATLEGRPGFLTVAGTGFASTTAVSSTASVNITGATPGAVHPWHVHAGTCASGGPIVGDPNAYTPLQVGTGGAASGVATIDVVLQPQQSYFINVHASPADLATIVACGDLQLR